MYRVDGKFAGSATFQMLGLYNTYEEALSAATEKGQRLSCETRIVEDRAGKRKSNQINRLMKQRGK